PAYAHLTNPTQPDAVAHDDPVKLAAATKTLLHNWNVGLQKIAPRIHHPDVDRPFEPYGESWAEGDLAEIPEEDLPPGLPAWMRSPAHWASRPGATPAEARRTVAVTVPD